MAGAAEQSATMHAEPPKPSAVAHEVAASLHRAAAKLSPQVAQMTLLASTSPVGSMYGDATKLTAGTPSKPQGLAARENNNKPKHAEVPPSVASTAAIVAQQLRANGTLQGLGVVGSAQGLGGVGSAQGLGGVGSARAVSASSRAQTHGRSQWIKAPPGVTPESRLTVQLPTTEFTYIGRPQSHFVARWAAIDWELVHIFKEESFSLLDLGSCHGFISLQAAVGYPHSLVVGVEGSVGVGNGTTGLAGTEDEIISTKAVQTHCHWIENLRISNCFVAPEVWDFRKICSIANLGRPICDVLLSLSVIHHIDGVSEQQYAAAKLSHLEGTVSLMAKVLQLANRHFIELPDSPWIPHVWQTFRSQQEFLEAAARTSGKQWSFVGPLVVSEWYGRRELWLLELDGPALEPIPWAGFKSLFQRLLGGSSGAAAGGIRSSNTTGVAAALRASDAQQSLPAKQLMGSHLNMHQEPRPSVLAPQQSTPEIRHPADASQMLPQEQLGAALLAAPTALIAAHVQLRDALAAADIALQDVGRIQ